MSAAQRIMDRHNTCGHDSGWLVFDSEGEGGAWYTANAYGFDHDLIVVKVRRSAMTLEDAEDAILISKRRPRR